MSTLSDAYSFMIDLLDHGNEHYSNDGAYDAVKPMSLGVALEITAETYDLSLAQERELMMRYLKEHC